MSSRALRRARQELDIKPDPVAAEGSHDKSEEEVDTEYNHGHGRFDLLYEAASSDNESSVNDDYEGKTESDRHSAETASTKKPINKVSRKKKAKRKASQKRKETDLDDGNVVEDLDRILEALSFKVRKKSEDHAPITGSLDDAFFSLLAINTRDLHIQNEMKRLFGKIVTDHSSAPVAEGSGGRRAAGDRRARIARNQLTGGRGIPFITLKRNPFIEGKEEWLQILGVGLAMEKMEEGPNGATTYTTVHRPIYQDIQRQFILCVASMDPESLIQLHQSHRKSLNLVREIEIPWLWKEWSDGDSISCCDATTNLGDCETTIRSYSVQRPIRESAFHVWAMRHS